jgi:hypothetical protein
MKTNAFIHDNTKNMSFVKMYKTLKGLDVVNNKFFLALYDNDLRDVDPHTPNLSSAIQIKILAEVMRNPWYFYREVVRIKVPGGIKPFELHRGNLALLWCIHQNLKAITLLPRQHYKTISTVCAFSWLINFGSKNSNYNFSNKELKDSQLNVKRLKDIDEQLPPWLIPANKRDDVENINSRSRADQNNVVNALPSPRTEEDADKLGRGNTTPGAWYDELAFLKYNRITWAAAMPAMSQAFLEAKALNNPHFLVITTTPNDITAPSGIFCKELIDRAAPFVENLYDWSKIKIDKYIEDNSQNDLLSIEFSYKQLGRTEGWLKSQCRALNWDMNKIKRELLLQWTKTSESSLFTEREVMNMDNNVKPIIKTIFVGKDKNIPMFFTKLPDFNKSYVIGVDVAAGLALDSSTIVITDPITLEPIGYMKNNTIDTDDLFDLICSDILGLLFSSSVIAIERNSMGITIIDRLKKTKFEKNMFFTRPVEQGQKTQKSMKTKTQSTTKKIYGINTSASSRVVMIDILMNTIRENPEIITLEEIVKEISTLERNKNGKIEHAAGCHDDVLFGYLLSRFACSGTGIDRQLGNNSSNKRDAVNDYFNSITNMNDEGYFGGLNHANANIAKIAKIEDEMKAERKYVNILSLNDM